MKYVWLVARLAWVSWLVLACIGLIASFVWSSSLLRPVAAATIFVCVGPLLDHAWSAPLRSALRSHEPKVYSANAALSAFRIVASASIVPGLGVAAALSLLLPTSPFLHGTAAVAALAVALFTWLPISLAVAAVAFRALKSMPEPAIWHHACRIGIAIVFPFVVFSIVICACRPDPDGYWRHLEPVRTKSNPCVGLCAFPVDDKTCAGVSHAYGPGLVETCPAIEARRDPRTGRLLVSRTEIDWLNPWGSSSVHFVDMQHRQPDGSNEAEILTTFGIRHQVSTPLIWVALAAGGLGFAIFLLQRERRRLAAIRRAERIGNGPYRRAFPAPLAPEVEVERAWTESLVWRYALFVLVASSTPMMVALVLGVGR